jgi:catechol 2,3-dioxygenase
MPVPMPVFNPPFNIVRCAYMRLNVQNIAASRKFYADIVGLIVEEETGNTLYLRGLEELNHHSLILAQATEASCAAIGFRVAFEEDLDKAKAWYEGQGLAAEFIPCPFQGRTLRAVDPQGYVCEYFAQMERRPSLLREYSLYKGAQLQRLDHFNMFSANVQASIDFYAQLGFRVTEYAEQEPQDGGRIAAAWMHRKGNVHDLAFTHGVGPRLHHFCYWSPTAMNIIHLCDVMASSGYLANLERGPGRHGISNAFFLYVRDPDGHRLELYTSDYQTMDPDHPPLRWSLRDPRRQTLWGSPAPKSWFEEGSPFPNTPVLEPNFKANVIVAD